MNTSVNPTPQSEQGGWDDQVHGNGELEARLRAAVRAATLAGTKLWERTTHRRGFSRWTTPTSWRAA